MHTQPINQNAPRAARRGRRHSRRPRAAQLPLRWARRPPLWSRLLCRAGLFFRERARCFKRVVEAKMRMVQCCIVLVSS